MTHLPTPSNTHQPCIEKVAHEVIALTARWLSNPDAEPSSTTQSKD